MERVKLAELALVEFVVLGSLFAVFREELVVHRSLFVAYFVSLSLYSVFDESHLVVTQLCFVYPEFVSDK
jgi:hypothetical protein